MSVRDRAMLDAAIEVLLARPTASLSEVAAGIGVSRTTLHNRFPTRQALLVALAHDAIDQVAAAYDDSRLDEDGVREALARVVEATVPLGPRLEFLLRERSLDDDADLTRRYLELDRPLLELIERGRGDGELRRDVPTWWLASSLLGTVYAAWEAIADGRLAPRDATDLVLTSVLDGAVPR